MYNYIKSYFTKELEQINAELQKNNEELNYEILDLKKENDFLKTELSNREEKIKELESPKIKDEKSSVKEIVDVEQFPVFVHKNKNVKKKR